MLTFAFVIACTFFFQKDVKAAEKTGYAGTITAGMFIEKFVGETPWIHLDIAGSSWADAPYDFYTLGGTGQMVKTLFNFVKNY